MDYTERINHLTEIILKEIGGNEEYRQVALKVAHNIDDFYEYPISDEYSSHLEQAVELLKESFNQLEYLDEKFQTTGTSNQLKSRIENFINYLKD